MKIIRLKVCNLFSYKEAELRPEDYNVVVGYNASGKTNLVRILKLLAGYRVFYSLESVYLQSEFRLSPDEDSYVIVELELSDEEARLLAELFLKKTLARMDSDKMKRIQIFISWPATADERESPDFVMLRFANGFSFWRRHNEELLGFMERLPETKDSIIATTSSFRGVKNDQDAEAFSKKHRFSHDQMLLRSEFQEPFLAGESVERFFTLGSDAVCFPATGVTVKYDHNRVERYSVELFEFCELKKESSHFVHPFYFTAKMIERDFAFLSEIPPDFGTLAEVLYKIKNDYRGDDVYRSIQEAFSSMFGGARVSVHDENAADKSKKSQPVITVDDDRGSFVLEDTASGYFDALNLLIRSVNKSHHVLILDEPALHLHPAKIRYLSRLLAMTASVQILIITHSPYFVEPSVFSKGRSLAYIKKDADGHSMILNKPDGFNFDIKQHLFNPDIFFSRCSVFVEGPGDASALTALSDALNNIFEEGDIAIIYPGGKGYVHKYLDLLSAYGISYVAMVDNDYEFEKTDSFVKLKGKLEDELRKLGYKQGGENSVDPDRAYELVFDRMQEDKEKVRKTALGRVFDMALEKAGKNPDTMWRAST